MNHRWNFIDDSWVEVGNLVQSHLGMECRMNFIRLIFLWSLICSLYSTNLVAKSGPQQELPFGVQLQIPEQLGRDKLLAAVNESVANQGGKYYVEERKHELGLIKGFFDNSKKQHIVERDETLDEILKGIPENERVNATMQFNYEKELIEKFEFYDYLAHGNWLEDINNNKIKSIFEEYNKLVDIKTDYIFGLINIINKYENLSSDDPLKFMLQNYLVGGQAVYDKDRNLNKLILKFYKTASSILDIGYMDNQNLSNAFMEAEQHFVESPDEWMMKINKNEFNLLLKKYEKSVDYFVNYKELNKMNLVKIDKYLLLNEYERDELNKNYYKIYSIWNKHWAFPRAIVELIFQKALLDSPETKKKIAKSKDKNMEKIRIENIKIKQVKLDDIMNFYKKIKPGKVWKKKFDYWVAAFSHDYPKIRPTANKDIQYYKNKLF